MAEKPQIGRLCCHFLNGEQAIRISVYTGFKGRSQITKIASDFTMAQKCTLSLMRIDQIGQLCKKGIKIGVDIGVVFFRHSAYPLFQNGGASGREGVCKYVWRSVVAGGLSTKAQHRKQ